MIVLTGGGLVRTGFLGVDGHTVSHTSARGSAPVSKLETASRHVTGNGQRICGRPVPRDWMAQERVYNGLIGEMGSGPCRTGKPARREEVILVSTSISMSKVCVCVCVCVMARVSGACSSSLSFSKRVFPRLQFADVNCLGANPRVVPAFVDADCGRLGRLGGALRALRAQEVQPKKQKVSNAPVSPIRMLDRF